MVRKIFKLVDKCRDNFVPLRQTAYFPKSTDFNVFFIAYMHVIHTSAECYPVAKAGGLADVVGALPKYQNEKGGRQLGSYAGLRCAFYSAT